MTLPIVVLISGTGSNLRAILDAIAGGRCAAEVRAVISDRDSAKGLELARAHGIPSAVLRLKDFPDRDQWNAALAAAVAGFAPELVVLAGFMRVVGAPFIQRFPFRIINVHPALLPLFPGTDGPAQALRAGVRVSGCTVHVVDSGVDTGTIIGQAAVAVLPDDDEQRLHERIQRAERRLLPSIIDAIARGTIVLGSTVRHEPPLRDDGAVLACPSVPDPAAP
jgi:phosphoribosylglycinamide formyltransferase-1